VSMPGEFIRTVTGQVRAAWQHSSIAGLALGTLFLAFSLTPSLLPRPVLFQGVVSGLALAAGYALGVAVRDLWSYLELPYPNARRQRWLRKAAVATSATEGRAPDSPAWLPRYRDGSVVRFMNQWGGLDVGFSASSLYRQPAWLAEPRPADVSSTLRWYPVVTALQLAADMAVANTAPAG